MSGAFTMNSGIFRANNRTGTIPLAKGTGPGSVWFIGIVAEGSASLRFLRSEPLHYAAVSLSTSMELWRKSEVQSKRVSQPSYSRQDARSVEAVNCGTDSAREAKDCGHRWDALFI